MIVSASLESGWASTERGEIGEREREREEREERDRERERERDREIERCSLSSTLFSLSLSSLLPSILSGDPLLFLS